MQMSALDKMAVMASFGTGLASSNVEAAAAAVAESESPAAPIAAAAGKASGDDAARAEKQRKRTEMEAKLKAIEQRTAGKLTAPSATGVAAAGKTQPAAIAAAAGIPTKSQG
jgi:hypothetical protein